MACYDQDNGKHASMDKFDNSWKTKFESTMCPHGTMDFWQIENLLVTDRSPNGPACTWEGQAKCWFDEKTHGPGDAAGCGCQPGRDAAGNWETRNYEIMMADHDCIACSTCDKTVNGKKNVK